MKMLNNTGIYVKQFGGLYKMPNATKCIEFQTTLREMELFWFIKRSTMHQNPTINEAQQRCV